MKGGDLSDILAKHDPKELNFYPNNKIVSKLKDMMIWYWRITSLKKKVINNFFICSKFLFFCMRHKEIFNCKN